MVNRNRIDTASPADQCIHEIFSAQAQQRPSAVAIQFEDQRVTYAELERRSNQLAHHLRKFGVGPNIYVTVLMGRSVELIVSLLGILKAGGAYAPLDPSYPATRLVYMMEDTNAPVLLAQACLQDQLPHHDAKVVCIDDDWKTIAHEPDTCPPVEGGPDDLAYVNYTSGSTGQPKGVELVHRGVTRLVKNTNFADLNSNETFLHLAPITFDASTFEIWGCLLNGAKLVVFPEHIPTFNELGQFIQRHSITTLWLTAGLFHKMVEHNLGGLRGLHQLLTGGDVVSVQHAKKYLKEADNGCLINGYGPTENTTFTTCFTMTEESQIGSTVPIGSPIANTAVYVLDDNLRPVAAGEEGELYTGGAGLARGYLNQPELTREKFISNPFNPTPGERLYKTGDLVRYLPNGDIEFLGRTDDQVKIRGKRIELEEIRSVMRRHPAVRDAVVVARREKDEKYLAAYAVPGACRDQYHQATSEHEKHVSNWQGLYDQLYDTSVTVEDPSFNIVGWNSSYTGEPIPPEEMQEWVNNTVEQVMRLNPRRVLEIGCGTGLLLFRIAPNCNEYVATDLSPVVIRNIEMTLATQTESLPQVRLLARPAHDFDDIEIEAYDTIILNSVVQYFPTIDYLRDVLESAIECVSPDGFVFIGDLRSLPLLKSFHAAVELDNVAAETSCELLKQRIRTGVLEEDELVIDPAFFAVLKLHIPKIRHVEICPKRGRAQNEMTQFRYDVVLHMSRNPVPIVQPVWQDWQQAAFTLEKLRRTLENAAGEVVAFSNISNAQVCDWVAAVDCLPMLSGTSTVKELLEWLKADNDNLGVTPEDICGLGALLCYNVQTSWANSDATGAFDAVFYPNCQTLSVFEFPAPTIDDTRPWTDYATEPAQGHAARTLIPELKNLVEKSLPDYMAPSYFVLLDAMPLNSNGKIDHKFLPKPNIELDRNYDQYVAPRDALEQSLADIWQDTLGIKRIGIHDDFFHLGGSSLQAAELFLKIGARFKRDLPLAILAKNPTIKALSEVLHANADESWASLVPIHTSGTKPPLFCIHGGRGNVVSFRKLSQMLGGNQPFYGLQWNGFSGKTGHTTIEEMASSYLQQIRTVQPNGPYLVAGHCVGGLVAYEMAQQLTAQGESVAIVAMFDTPNIKSKSFIQLPLWELLLIHLRQHWLLDEIRYHLAYWANRLVNRSLHPYWDLYGKRRDRLWQNPLTPIIHWVYRVSGSRFPGSDRQLYVIESMISAVRQYRPTPYPGRIVYFHAGNQKQRLVPKFPGKTVDGMFGWAPTTSDKFEFYVVPNSDHNSIVTDPKTADILKNILDDAGEGVGLS